jgi:catechol 2,3-dioxygenase-like lactoylglutathione lyase family enzyme
MTVSLSTVHILADDPDLSLAFYRDAVGLAVLHEVANGGFRWITLGLPSQPGVAIVLSEPHAGRSQDDGDAMAALLAKGEMRPVHFRFDDLDAAFQRIASADAVTIIQEPAEQPWGLRDAAVRDPAGNFLRLEQA